MSCDELAKQIEKDTTKTIWSYNNISPDTYYCLGKYFAQKDIENEIYIIQTYGSPEWADPCRICGYKSYGISFHYLFDIIIESETRFIEGYNEVSKAYLKSKIGDSAFAKLNETSESNFNPRMFISEAFGGRNIKRYTDISIINDTLINVKLKIDSVYKEYPQIKTKVKYKISAYNAKNKKMESEQIFDYKEIQTIGFYVTKGFKNRYIFEINFDFKDIANLEGFCWCPSMNYINYGYVIPLVIDNE